MAERILVVEDEATLRQNVVRYLERAGHQAVGVETLAQGTKALESSTFDVLVTDLRLPDGSGMDLLPAVERTSPGCVTLVMTAYASIEAAVDALRQGAHDFMLKPLSLSDLRRRIEHIAAHRRLARENTELRRMLHGTDSPYERLRCGGPTMRSLCAMLDKAAASESNVLVEGESGTGKELVARALHERSARATGPFVTVDIRAAPQNAAESYLFGAARTATGEHRDGPFRAASGGTLFLDEVGELDLGLQAKLLRAAETKEILPCGAETGVRVDVRIVAATQHDLERRVREGAFRADLFYRLGIVRLRVPPLRERLEDVVLLAERLLERHAAAQSKSVRYVSPEAQAVLSRYGWPGNVRELSNVIERAVILSDGDTITALDLPTEIGVAAGDAGASPAEVAPAGDGPLSEDACNFERAVLGFQRRHLARVLRQVNGNREAAARLLGLSSATLYRYLARAGLKGYQPEKP